MPCTTVALRSNFDVTTAKKYTTSTNKLPLKLNSTTNTSNTKLELLLPLKKALSSKTWVSAPAQPTNLLFKQPEFKPLILGPYTNTELISARFPAIDALAPSERINYKQLANSSAIKDLRHSLCSLIDTDLRAPLESLLMEWATFGISITEIDRPLYARFKEFYDETMSEYAIRKDDYSKLDFAAQNIKPYIADSRCLAAKLTPLHIFRAAYQLGTFPGVSNFRFMENPPSKNDGKYREWMIHLDNSNYDAEYKIITTRSSGSCAANEEQCLAAFPYDTTQHIRFTKSEAATKFPTLEDLENEFRDVPGARYVVLRNGHGIPLETGIRTEMIPHHRSASDKDGQESRSSELMTFHGVERCKPFLTDQERALLKHLTPMQDYILGGFKSAKPGAFMEYMTSEKEHLNTQLRILIDNEKIKHLQEFTVANFAEGNTTITNEIQFNKQVETYENLTELPEKLPYLTLDCYSPKETVLAIVPALMNHDQNAALKPDCSENDAFPARTQIREREKYAFLTPLKRDLDSIKFNIDFPLLKLDQIIDLAKTIENFYNENIELLAATHSNAPIDLYRSRAALANEYTQQLLTRATTNETHQTLCLFIYYMIEDLRSISQLPSSNGTEINEASLKTILQQQKPLLQHFITHRMLSDMGKP